MKRFHLSFVSFAFLALLLASCNNEPSYRLIQFRGEIFGTYYSISYYDKDGRWLKDEVDTLLNQFNASLSTYKKNSIISRINRNEIVEGDAFFNTVFNRSQEISKITDGAFDPTVAPLVNAWGFGFTSRPQLSKKMLDSISDFVGFEKIRLSENRITKDDPRIMLDFNAIAKGYAVDVVADFLREKGIESFLAEIGGEVVAGKAKPNGNLWRVGIEKPADSADAPQEWEVLVEIENRAIATSGTYRKYYEEKGVKYSHTIDPKTASPVSHSLLSATVVANDCMTADAFATAFMVMGVDAAIAFAEQHKELEAFFIYDDGKGGFKKYKTPGLNVKSKEQLARP